MSITPGDAAAYAPDADRIRIAGRSPADPDASRLLSALHREQVGRYGFADPAELNPCDYTAPNGIFAVAYLGAVPVGCGGYRWFDRAARMVEIKRLYVAPAARGHGTGRVLLSWLEQHAAVTGAQRAILETGIRNTAALSLFTAAGYRPVDSYVPGRDPQINRAFARTLTDTA